MEVFLYDPGGVFFIEEKAAGKAASGNALRY
jgi:hypothetical protein